MTTTVKDIFSAAMVLMEQESDDGTYDGYPADLKKKAWPILNILQLELMSTIPTIPITDENSPIQADERVSIMALPNGLAAHLLTTTDPNRASFYNARFDELKAKRPATTQTMTDTYWEGTTTTITDGG
jgi:hypothetical protein